MGKEKWEKKREGDKVEKARRRRRKERAAKEGCGEEGGVAWLGG